MKALIAALGLMLSFNVYARTPLETQPKVAQCGYKANVVAFVVEKVRQHERLKIGKPVIHINLRRGTTDAERQMVEEYLRYAWTMSQTDLDPQDASKQTFEAVAINERLALTK